MVSEVENVRIKRTQFGIEDHGIMTFMIMLEGSGWGVGWSGYALTHKDGASGAFVGWGPGLVAIRTILETVGVSNWEDLPGTLCRVRKVRGLGGSGSDYELGHIIDDRWFYLDGFMKAEARDD